jgi:hemoglobin
MRPTFKMIVGAAIVAVSVTAFFLPIAQAGTPYEEFGGKPGIDKVVDTFVATVLADPRIKAYFVPAQTPRLKYELKQQFCALLDGPCTYTGRDMKSTHQGMKITQAAFNALDEDLNSSMDKYHVPIDAQNYLTGKLAPMEQPIVTR